MLRVVVCSRFALGRTLAASSCTSCCPSFSYAATSISTLGGSYNPLSSTTITVNKGQWQPSRSYIFLPVSWNEFRSTIQTWLGKRAKERTIWVKRIKENYRSNVSTFFHNRSYNQQRPSRYRAGRHWWRQRRGVWMNKMFKSRLFRQHPVQLTEYSKAHWFDANGYPLTARDESGRFVNPWSSQSTNGSHPIWEFVTWRLERLRVWNKRETVPVAPVPWELQNSNHQDHLSLTWIGHSTCLVRLSGYNILTDPMFSHRASPVQWLPLGVPRHVQAACQVENLPPIIDVVLLSHDHYDHLDKTSCRALKDRVQLWAVPLNMKEWLVEKCDIDPTKIIDLEWWQHHTLSLQLPVPQDRPPLTLTCAPAQHWGSRTMWDRNHRLWCSWAVSSPSRNFYFGGDTGYPTDFPLFWQIGDALGPFDLAAIPIGAYAPRFFMADSHIHPSEAVKIHEQVRSKKSVAIHWGTFALAEEDDDEPPRLLEKEAASVNIDFTSIRPGETVSAEAVVEEPYRRSTALPIANKRFYYAAARRKVNQHGSI